MCRQTHLIFFCAAFFSRERGWVNSGGIWICLKRGWCKYCDSGHILARIVTFWSHTYAHGKGGELGSIVYWGRAQTIRGGFLKKRGICTRGCIQVLQSRYMYTSLTGAKIISFMLDQINDGYWLRIMGPHWNLRIDLHLMTCSFGIKGPHWNLRISNSQIGSRDPSGICESGLVNAHTVQFRNYLSEC